MEKGKQFTVYLFSMRIASTLLSFGILSFLIRNLSLPDFASIQAFLSLLGIFYWILDFGSTNILIMSYARSENLIFRKLMGIRLIIFLIFMFTSTVVVSSFCSWQLTILYFALSLDLAYESLNSLRQVSFGSDNYFWGLIGRRVFQISSLFFLGVFHEVSLINIGVMYIFSSIAPLLLDIFKFKPIFTELNFASYLQGRLLWFQGGGTSLANLDIWLLSQGPSSIFVPSVVVGKRISSSIGLIGGVLTPETLLLTSKLEGIDSAQTRKIVKWTIASVGLSLLILLNEERILQLMMGSHSSEVSHWIIRLFVISVPLGILNSNLNAILIGLQAFKHAAFSTYLSTTIYLSLIFAGIFTGKAGLFIPLGIAMNLLSESLLLFIFVTLKRRRRVFE